MTGAGSVKISTVSNRETGAGSSPSPALQAIRVAPLPRTAAKRLLEREHYLHSLPGGTKLTFGVFLNHRLLGALTFGVGPFMAYHLVEGATPDDCLCLTRLWLSDELPRNSESRVLGIITRSIKKNTNLKFLMAYSDPSAGHVGTIYQACGWLYTGLSSAMPLYDLGDGKLYHSRSLAHCYGSHSMKFFNQRGVTLKTIPQAPKHRYIRFLDPAWQSRLEVSIQPYPKRQGSQQCVA